MQRPRDRERARAFERRGQDAPEPRRAARARLSVVVALHDEEACLPALLQRLRRAIDEVGCAAELLLVDDGSTDGSFALIEAEARADARIRGISLARNVGHQVALLCGLERATGDVALTLDADLQHPPELLGAMLEAWESGADVVNMRRTHLEREKWLREVSARAFYWIYARATGTLLSPGSTDFRLLDRRAVEALIASRPERGLLRAAVRALPFTQVELGFRSPVRLAGASRYTYLKLAALASEALIAGIPKLRREADPRGGGPLYAVRAEVGGGR